MNIIQTEYSFKEVFYHLEKAIDDSIYHGHKDICIMDRTTFGFIKFEKLCIEKNVNPIYGLRVHITDEKIKSRSKYESYGKCEEIYLIAKTKKGVCDLFDIYTLSTEQKYYFNRIYPKDLIDRDLIIIADNFQSNFKKNEFCIPFTKYSLSNENATYQCITGSRGISAKREFSMNDTMLLDYFTQDQIKNKNRLPDFISSFMLKKSGMIKYNGKKNFELECWKGFDRLDLNDKPDYIERLEYEINLIKKKRFQDYFMIVSEMITDAKDTMLVGPGRGSSGGSLVCFCLGITNIDPIRFGLIFERFIDVNRNDLPDIDSDYPDNKRNLVIERTAKKYKSAYQLGIVSRYKPKSVINDFAKEYGISLFELEELKNSIVERSSGDARSQACLEDTFIGTDVGKKFIEQYPYMKSCIPAEGHARHYGKHAAGIIVTDEDMSNYSAIDKQSGTLCIEGNDAESIGLLKIDCLGLRTLSVIENCLRLSGVDINEIYEIDLEDKNVFDTINSDDLADIFQFDGDAIRRIKKQITVTKFEDIAAITSLGRPGALNSGGTNRYVKVYKGEAEPIYYGDIYESVTKDTNGIVVYQEQAMKILKEYGNLSWGDVNTMRKIISKSRGDEFFESFKDKFMNGAIERGESEKDAIEVWDAIASMGSYAFNKSHAVAYGMISYWCAYCKYKYPLNFLAANLNNAKDDAHGLKMLRAYVQKYNIEYVPVDPDISDVYWTIQSGRLIGGLTNIKGVGEKKAKGIIDKRENGIEYTKSVYEKLMNPITAYDELYPLSTRYANLYKDNEISKINDLIYEENSIIIGKVLVKDLRDRNDIQFVIRRGGTKVDTDQFFLSLTVEDDTGSIRCLIAPFDMDKLNGIDLSKNLNVGDDVVIKGKMREGWQFLSIKQIVKASDFI